ncbi:MAG: FixH family protein [Proteobacteria bacterium]|nr:FixH family protein [Pseudomonadota bacterium]
MTRKLTGKHVAFILAGFFGVMFAVNGVFVYFALDSFSGVSVDDAYRRGLDYNQELAQKQRQEERNWQHSLEFVQTGEGAGKVTLVLDDAEGNRIAGLTVNGHLKRPVIDVADSPVEFLELGQSYIAELDFADKGQWDIVIQLEGGGFEDPYRLEKRIWVE